MHSTRRAVATAVELRFTESHSHSVEHLLLPDGPLLDGPGPLVLVDDELSTGKTAAELVRVAHRWSPRTVYLVAVLVDARPDDGTALDVLANELGVEIEVVALVSASVKVPDDAPRVADRLIPEMAGEAPLPAAHSRDLASQVHIVDIAWREGRKETGRHGFDPADTESIAPAVDEAAHRLVKVLREVDTADRAVHVLATEELMYVPLRIAARLEQLWEGGVTFSSTTRSPVVPLDDPGYAVRSGLCFRSSEDDGDRFAYNLPAGDVVVLTDAAAAGPSLWGEGALIDCLVRSGSRVYLAVLPDHRTAPGAGVGPLRGPAFGSYAEDEVGWLLKDLSDVPLEAELEEREDAVQTARAHYAESLPIEYTPSSEYVEHFHRALNAQAVRVARDVGSVTELVLAKTEGDVVLVSLARAGTPVGVLMRRWAATVHGLDLPHYAISIVRRRGIDLAALRWLEREHGSARVQFVDGWTGKGAITRELAEAVRNANLTLGTAFDPELAVLADPGSTTRMFGTREDYLVPSACLNSTVSGLVSRTVLRRDLVGPGEFHGAKFYGSLAGSDLSATLLDTVAGHFCAVADEVRRTTLAIDDARREPTWAGWRSVLEVGRTFGIDDPNLIKPGVGETTRVLLRRVPWQVLVSPDAGPDVEHVRVLAQERGVPVIEHEGLAYSCVGLIRPIRAYGEAAS